MRDINERAESLLQRLEEKKRAASVEIKRLWQEMRASEEEFRCAMLRSTNAHKRMSLVRWLARYPGHPYPFDHRQQLAALVERQTRRFIGDRFELSETIQVDAKLTK